MLIKFFVSAANNGYLNGLANEFNESTNSIRKELNNYERKKYPNGWFDGAIPQN